MNAFKGIGVALVTPFLEDQRIDFESLKRLIDHVISGGVDYLVALGTTGALAWFAPIQPFLALIGLAILVGAIMHRVWLLRGTSITTA